MNQIHKWKEKGLCSWGRRNHIYMYNMMNTENKRGDAADKWKKEHKKWGYFGDNKGMLYEKLILKNMPFRFRLSNSYGVFLLNLKG